MAIAKVLEVISEGSSVEDAVENSVKEVSSSVRNITGVYVEGIKAIVADGAVSSYRVNCKVTFIVDSADD